MQVQLACVLVLCFSCGGLCSVSELEPDQRALTQEILSSLFSAKMRHNKQSAPFWRVSLSTLCQLVTSTGDEGRGQEQVEQEEEEPEGAELGEPVPASLNDELYGLRLLCRVLQNTEQRILSDSLDYMDSEVPPKRKSPYILKRQTSHSSKFRRPYILKRSPVY